METKEFKELLNRYRAGQASAEESAFLESWYMDFGKTGQIPMDEAELKQAQQLIWQQFVKNHIELAPIKRRLWPRYLGIAAAVAAIAFGIYFYTSRHPEGSAATKYLYANDIAPGKNTAILTVNGKQTQLSDAKAGIVVNDDIKYNDGTKIDPSLRGGTTWQSQPLTVTTPKGGTYSIILQDGTKVWLNSDSKLEVLPIFWNKVQRLVQLTGEAYFEVAQNKHRPFTVQSGTQSVTVLGTHFNISAYKEDDVMKTTLLEGAVRISFFPPGGNVTTKERLLKPNQQCDIIGDQLTIKQVNANDAIAWKNGYFKFDNEPLGNIMQKVSRWYNVEIEYKDESLRALEFGGTVSRYDKVSAVLSKLALTEGVKFKITGNKIIVTK